MVKNFKIKKGETVLDMGTGSGLIAIFACYQGAHRVVAVDINPWALKSAGHNARLHGFGKIIELKKSDLFQNIKHEKFDVITANLPFRNKRAHDLVAAAQWDTDLKTNRGFFKKAGNYLQPNGRIYFTQSNFGAMPEIKTIARTAGFSITMIGSSPQRNRNLKRFYAFVARTRKQ